MVQTKILILWSTQRFEPFYGPTKNDNGSARKKKWCCWNPFCETKISAPVPLLPTSLPLSLESPLHRVMYISKREILTHDRSRHSQICRGSRQRGWGWNIKTSSKVKVKRSCVFLEMKIDILREQLPNEASYNKGAYQRQAAVLMLTGWVGSRSVFYPRGLFFHFAAEESRPCFTLDETFGHPPPYGWSSYKWKCSSQGNPTPSDLSTPPLQCTATAAAKYFGLCGQTSRCGTTTFFELRISSMLCLSHSLNTSLPLCRFGLKSNAATQCSNASGVNTLLTCTLCPRHRNVSSQHQSHPGNLALRLQFLKFGTK